ncbi:MAG: hypothetical protein M0Z41_15790 [Peptococcaceae bacterium]|nr:hypothetical protein [Peptococcaceae bacterium]
MKDTRSIVIAVGSVLAFLSIAIFPIRQRAQVASLSWTRNMHVLIGPTLLRAAAIVLLTLLVAHFLPRKT